jgi:hypothetical protein
MRLSTNIPPIRVGSVLGTTIVRTKSKIIDDNSDRQTDSLIKPKEEQNDVMSSDYVSNPMIKTTFAYRNNDGIDLRHSNLQCTRMKLSTAPESVKTR